ncbi:hypothetical protein POM88_001488 [Heracleum sosnowskyi]|uniref:Uncharacterized protein n=1 Tax=Heracleum sosnowskyi TaxID=360622 RepID=A0AAD8NBQ8_9APIA|nr:hypothetical protein POM88_001488 [Heracleum sosnowskyi]
MDKGKEKKKRNVENNEEESEEEKMEEFFALIKSTRRVGGVDRRKESENQAKHDEEKPKINIAAAGWRPMFQPEDFLVNKINSVPAPANNIAGSSTTADDDQNKQEMAEEGNDILNLKLSL